MTCEFPQCPNATAGDAPMCSQHTNVRVHPSYLGEHAPKRRHPNYEQED